jgi:amino acid transporter
MTDETNPINQQNSGSDLVPSINWKQGLIIAMGIPILIVPSLFDLSVSLWGMSIAIWTLSVLSGFLVNIPLGEMCATFGVAGIGGSIQHVFKNDEKYANKKINTGRLIGAYGAWAYFTTWVPVIPIFTIMTADYLFGYFDVFAGIDGIYKTLFYLFIGGLMYGFIIMSGRKGLEGGAKTQLILSVITIIPILVIVLVPLINGNFHFETITTEFYPTGWKWDGNGLLMVLGCFTVAQWSAVAWESSATYGAEYKDPGKDVPKALISCGLVCLFMYFIISFCMYGTLGIEGIINAPSGGAATLIPVAIGDFGEIGGAIAVILLIAGMIMIVQTAFLGAARTIQIMAKDGNLPMTFAKTNSYGVPMNAMYFEAVIGFVMILAGVTASQILAVSALGFDVAFGLAMYAFIKARRDPRFKDVERKYKAPRWAVPGAYFMLIFEVFFMIPGILYYVYELMGFAYVIIGLAVNLLYIPCWFVIQWWNTQAHPELKAGVKYAKEANPRPKLFGALAVVGAVFSMVCVFGHWGVLGGTDMLGTEFLNADYITSFEKFIPTIACILAVIVGILESVNFFIPSKNSNVLAAATLAVAVIEFALIIVFAAWSELSSFGGAGIIALAGALVSIIFATAQNIGIHSKTENALNAPMNN